MISCREAGRLLSESLERRLSLWERLKLRFHLLICSTCSRASSQVLLVNEAAQRLAADPRLLEIATGVKLPEDVRDRIKEAMRAAGSQD